MAVMKVDPPGKQQGPYVVVWTAQTTGGPRDYFLRGLAWTLDRRQANEFHTVQSAQSYLQDALERGPALGIPPRIAKASLFDK